MPLPVLQAVYETSVYDYLYIGSPRVRLTKEKKGLQAGVN